MDLHKIEKPKGFWLYGKGNVGKTTFINTMRDLANRDEFITCNYIDEIDIAQIIELQPKVIYFSEFIITNESRYLLKRLLGGDTEYVNDKEVKLSSDAIIIVVSNELPNNDDLAFKSKFKYVEFKNPTDI